MSDPLGVPRQAAGEMMMRSTEVALKKVCDTLLTAFGRSAEALRTATTQDEITTIQNRFVVACARLAETPFVTRS